MVKIARFCDICAGDGKVVLARGSYRFTAGGHRYDACRKHLVETDKAGALTIDFDFVGALNPIDFIE
ncbi:MAG: hypothetical protein ACWGNI_00985 [Desulfobacterales bacterium]